MGSVLSRGCSRLVVGAEEGRGPEKRDEGSTMSCAMLSSSSWCQIWEDIISVPDLSIEGILDLGIPRAIPRSEFLHVICRLSLVVIFRTLVQARRRREVAWRADWREGSVVFSSFTQGEQMGRDLGLNSSSDQQAKWSQQRR
ncbi:hypothetical protein Pcinc_017017 [Petrolisthes cinctipes]|uniref:Uncharacterized protein n=1 Tax=Petrolisthes cinctipes TaxID=88211 RepID=A0AAE1FV66_PETCI|nr:hypothetical protein Pcinc_017017 [Petrolisthes cinctipes]